MIESYFKGELPSHIKDKVHEKIANDPKLKAKFISFALLKKPHSTITAGIGAYLSKNALEFPFLITRLLFG